MNIDYKHTSTFDKNLQHIFNRKDLIFIKTLFIRKNISYKKTKESFLVFFKKSSVLATNQISFSMHEKYRNFKFLLKKEGSYKNTSTYANLVIQSRKCVLVFHLFHYLNIYTLLKFLCGGLAYILSSFYLFFCQHKMASLLLSKSAAVPAFQKEFQVCRPFEGFFCFFRVIFLHLLGKKGT